MEIFALIKPSGALPRKLSVNVLLECIILWVLLFFFLLAGGNLLASWGTVGAQPEEQDGTCRLSVIPGSWQNGAFSTSFSSIIGASTKGGILFLGCCEITRYRKAKGCRKILVNLAQQLMDLPFGRERRGVCACVKL